MAHRGVSLLREVLAGSSPASIRRLHTAVVTQFPSLEFQVAGWTNEIEGYSGAVASEANTLLPGMWDPRKTWDRVFGSFTGGRIIDPEPGDRLFVPLRDQVVEIPNDLL